MHGSARIFIGMMVLGVCGFGFNRVLAQDTVTSNEKIVATIDGVTISAGQLNLAAADELEKLEMRKMQFEADQARDRHQIMEDTLDRLVEEHILDSEAERLGITREELIAREIDQKVQDPTDEEVDQFYEQNSERIRGSKEQVAGQIRRYLRQQNHNRIKKDYLDHLKESRQISLNLDPLRYDVAVEGHPSRGGEQAPVTIVEFSDFQCPYCRDFSRTLKRVLQEFPTEVRLVFRQLPLSEIHPFAEKAAEAALCAGEQGKFWEFHDLMFEDQGSLRVDQLKAKAVELGLDAAGFDACLDSGKQGPNVKQDIRDGARLGASGTPAVFINGRFLNGSRPFQEIASIVREELQKKGITAP